MGKMVWSSELADMQAAMTAEEYGRELEAK